MPRIWFLFFFAVVFVAAVTNTDAIVIRHDRDDADYQALGRRYPAAVRILPDGSGALVAANYVLTAAHVGQGIADRSPRVEVDGKEIEVERIFLHPDWSGRGAHDIALLRLKAPASGAQPVELYGSADEAGRVVTFVGDGDTGTGVTGPTEMDGKKRGATNRIDDVDDDWIRFTFNQGDDASDLEGVSGPGDSGGPAFAEVDGRLYVLGVSAYSFNGKPGRYGTREAYTRVSTHADWAQSIILGKANDPGIEPGSAKKGSDDDAVVRGNVTGQQLSDVAGGDIIAAYLQTYNADNGEQMFAFLTKYFSESYLAKKSKDEHLAYYGRLLHQHFGLLTLLGVVDASENRVVIRIDGNKGVMGEMHFTFAADSRIEDLVVAIVSVDPPVGGDR